MMGTSLRFPFSSAFGLFTFIPVGRGGSALAALHPNAVTGALVGAGDRLLDPATRDYVRTANGEWAETGDARTMMMIMLEIELGTSPYDSGDGTAIAALMRDGDPITPEMLQADAARAAGLLVTDGVIANLSVTVRDFDGSEIRTATGQLAVILDYTDLTTGNPINLQFQPR